MQLKYLFSELENYDYLVLRGYEGLPSTISNDLDFYIPEKSRIDFALSISKFFTSNGFVIVNKVKRYRFYQLYFYRLDDVVKVDIWTDFIYKGIKYLDKDKINVGCRIISGNIRVPSLANEVYLSFMKEALHVNHVRQDKQTELLKKLSKWDSLTCSLNDELLVRKILTESLSDCTLSLTRRKLLLLLLSNISQNFILTAVYRFLRSGLSDLLNLVHKHGYFIVFVGPDGSGKTTIMNSIRNSKYGQSFQSVSSFHGRFHKVPRISSILGKSDGSGYKGDDLKWRRERSERAISKLRINIYACYYLLDYMLGNVHMIIKRHRRGLVLFDRYYYDYFTQTINSNILPFLRFFYGVCAPKPDLVVLVSADSSVIYERKQELPKSEIDAQMRLQSQFPYRTSVCELDSSQDLETTMNTLLCFIRDERNSHYSSGIR